MKKNFVCFLLKGIFSYIIDLLLYIFILKMGFWCPKCGKQDAKWKSSFLGRHTCYCPNCDYEYSIWDHEKNNWGPA